MKAIEREKYFTHPYLLDTEYIEKLIHLSGISQQSAALDVCCGAGYSSIIFASYVKSVVGVDIDEGMLNKAKENIRMSEAWNVRVKYGNVESLEFDNETFDIVIARGAIRHVNNYKKAIQESYRVLKPMGRMFVGELVVPEEIIELWTEISIARTVTGKHYWTYNFLLRQFREAGFEPVLIIPVRHKQDLSEWLDEIDTANERYTAKRKIMSLDKQALKDIYFSESEPCFFIYDLAEILFEKRSVGDS